MLRTLAGLAAMAALLPALAAAQVTVIETSDFENGDDEIINIDECEGDFRSTFAISWRLPTTTAVPQVDVRISDTANCPLTSTTTTARTTSLGVFSGLTGSLATPQPANNIVTLIGLTCTGGQLRPINVCAVPTTAGDLTSGTVSSVIQLDGQVPTPPTNVRVSPGDGALDVSWDASSGANRYEIVATPRDGGPAETSAETTDTSRRISRLRNGVTYDVAVVALSLGGNPSAPSDPAVEGTPVEIDNFWRRYQEAGGQEEGGCSTAGGGGLALVGWAALVARRRGRRS
jgi:hypothetical protein